MKNEKLKIKKLLIVIILGSLFLPLVSQAALVPCGGPGQPACELCHLFMLIDNVIDFVLMRIVLPVATLIFFIGGLYFILAGGGIISEGKPEAVNKARSVLTAAVIGLVIIFGAFLLIGTFLNLMGLANWTTNIYRNWWAEGFFQIPCP